MTKTYDRADAAFFQHIPQELKSLPQWVCWKQIPDSGKPKPKKVPIAPLTGGFGTSTDVTTWATFEQAVTMFATNSEMTGIGFVFTANDPYCGIDLDNCIDPVSGELHSQARQYVDLLDSYTETTPSGAGLHVIVKAGKSGNKCKKGNYEIYDTGRYFTMTGRRFESSRPEIHERQEALTEVYGQIFGNEGNRPPPVTRPPKAEITDDALLDKLRTGPDASRFKRLWDGDWADDFASQSEADLALTGLMATYGAGAAQIDHMFRQSALMREKWDEMRGEKTYGQMTINKVLDGNPTSVNALLDELNSKYAVLSHGAAICILHEGLAADGITKDPQFMSPRDLSLKLANRPKVNDKKLDKWWIEHPQRREFDGVIFEPNTNNPRFYNLWTGFRIQPTAGDCTKFLSFVRDVICAGNQVLYEYVICWLAHMVQKPQELPEVALVLQSGQGTGKTKFVSAIGELVKPYYTTMATMDQLTGRFNGHLAGKLLIYANEALWGGNRQSAGPLKTMITDKEISIERKGKESITVSNYARLIVSSNEDWPVSADADDRRFLFIEVSDCHKEDHAYFADLEGHLNSGGYSALIHYLSTLDISAFDPRERPKTIYGVESKLQSAKPIVRWLKDVLYRDGITVILDSIAYADTTKWGDHIAVAGMYKAYGYYCKQQGVRYPGDESTFCKELYKILGQLPSSRPTNQSGERVRLVELPNQQAARHKLAQHLGIDVGALWMPEPEWNRLPGTELESEERADDTVGGISVQPVRPVLPFASYSPDLPLH